MLTRNLFYFFTLTIVFSSALFSQTTINEDPIYFSHAEEIHLRAEEIYTNGIGVRVMKGEYPVVNRNVLFISLNTNVLVFENDAAETTLPTDDDGYATPPFRLRADGDAIVIAKVVWASARTDVAYDARVTVRSYSVANRVMRLIPLFLFTIATMIAGVSYFKRLKKKTDKSTTAKQLIATLLGFTYVERNPVVFPIVILFECAVMYCMLMPAFGLGIATLLLLVALCAFTIKGDRGYALFFLTLSALGVAYAFGRPELENVVAQLQGIHPGYFNPLVAGVVFFAITMVTNGVYLPFFVLTIYATVINPPTSALIASLGGVFLASLLYLLLSHFKVRPPIIYRLNYIKNKDQGPSA